MPYLAGFQFAVHGLNAQACTRTEVSPTLVPSGALCVRFNTIAPACRACLSFGCNTGPFLPLRLETVHPICAVKQARLRHDVRPSKNDYR